jgi:ribosomal protein S18 acetylase RimI-like enzyme
MWTVRRYQPSDRSAVRQLAGDTAFFGDPIEGFFTARGLFLDAFANYYTDVAGDYLWVAQDGGAIAGYLMGCPDTHDYNTWFSVNVKRVAWRAATLRYRGLFKRRTLDYVWRYLRLHVPYLDLSSYPAHLHVNTRADKRGNGVGTALMNAYLDQLRDENVAGVHLETSSENKIAALWYERLGFQLLQRTSTNLYWASVGHSVDLLLYGMRL